MSLHRRRCVLFHYAGGGSCHHKRVMYLDSYPNFVNVLSSSHEVFFLEMVIYQTRLLEGQDNIEYRTELQPTCTTLKKINVPVGIA